MILVNYNRIAIQPIISHPYNCKTFLLPLSQPIQIDQMHHLNVKKYKYICVTNYVYKIIILIGYGQNFKFFQHNDNLFSINYQ